MTTLIEHQYIARHPGSAERHERAKHMFPNGVTHDARRQKTIQLFYNHATGSHKYDVDGNEVVDFWSGHGSLILGHSNPEIVKVVQDQMA